MLLMRQEGILVNAMVAIMTLLERTGSGGRNAYRLVRRH